MIDCNASTYMVIRNFLRAYVKHVSPLNRSTLAGSVQDGNCRLLDDKFGKTGQRMSWMPSLRKDALKYLYICPVLTVGHLLSGKVPDRLEIYVVLLLVDLE